MKTTFIFILFASLFSSNFATAQQDSITNTANWADSMSREKSQQGMNWKDSIKNAKAVNNAEKDRLNKDYNSVNQTYDHNRRLATRELNDSSIRNKESLGMYKGDRKEYKQDRRSLKRQKKDFDKAMADGVVSPEERAAMELKYKKDRVHYMDDKNSVNNQKDKMRDNSNNPQ